MRNHLCTFSLCIMGIMLSSCAHYQPRNFVPTLNVSSIKNPLYASFYGTSTLLISDTTSSILIDGFFSRQGIVESIVNRMKTSDEAIKVIKDKNIDAVLVSHSHFDHAKDAAVVADIKGARLLASKRTLEIYNNDVERPINVKNSTKVGDFKVTFIESKHAHKSFSKKLIERLFLFVAGGYEYSNAGDVYSYYIEHPQSNILVVPSADFPDKWAQINEKTASIVFLGIGLLGERDDDFIEKYWKSTVMDTCAGLVVPIHWDDFRIPLNKPLKSTPDLFNDVSNAMNKLAKLADKGNCNGEKVKILFPTKISPFSIKLGDYESTPLSISDANVN